MKNVLVVANFKAGRRRALSFKKRIMKFLFKSCERFKFIGVEDLNYQDFGGIDTIIVVGGDGTLNSVLPYANGKNLGVIPCGTANLLAQKLGIPTNLNRALEVIKSGVVLEIDKLDVNGRECVLRCGLGYDANIICHTPQSLKNRFGYFAYFIAGILYGFRLKKRWYTLKMDGVEGKVSASCIIAANSANMFRNLVNVGDSNLTDGAFEVFILKVDNPILFFVEFLKILFNLKINTAYTLFLHAKTLEIWANYFNLHVDGEPVKGCEKLTVKVSDEKVKVFSPFGAKTLVNS